MIGTLVSIMTQLYIGLTLDYNPIDKRKPISEIAATIWGVASIIRFIIFFLALIHKPFFKLLLIFNLIIWIAFVPSDLQEIRSMRYVMIMFAPLVFFSTLIFSFITMVLSNLGLIMLLIVTNKTG